MQGALLTVAAVALFLAAAFSGALVGGDRMRANYQAEPPADRAWRWKAAGASLAVSLLAALMAWLIR